MSQRELFRRGGINFVTKVLGQLLNLAQIPIYVAALLPERYGALNVGYVYLNFFVIFAVFGLNEALTRFYPSASGEDKKRIVSTALVFSLIWALALFAAHRLMAAELTIFFFNDPALAPFFTLMLIIAVVETFNLNITMLYQLEKKSGSYARALLGKNGLKLILTALFLLYFRWGVTGAALALLAGSLFYLIPALPLLRQRFTPRLSGKHLKKLLRYGAPFMITSLAMNTLFQIDQIILKFLTGLESVAVYGMAYKLGAAIQYLNGAFALAWFPWLFSLTADEARRAIPRTLKNYLLVALPLAVALTIAARQILPYFLPGEYSAATDIIPWVIWAYIAYSLSDFLGAGLFIRLRSQRFSLAALLAVAVNVGLNFLLIPQYGMIAAAWSTFISMALLTLVSHLLSRRGFPVSYANQGIVSATLSFLAIGALSLITAPAGLPPWLYAALLLLLLALNAYRLGMTRALQNLFR